MAEHAKEAAPSGKEGSKGGVGEILSVPGILTGIAAPMLGKDLGHDVFLEGIVKTGEALAPGSSEAPKAKPHQ